MMFASALMALVGGLRWVRKLGEVSVSRALIHVHVDAHVDAHVDGVEADVTSEYVDAIDADVIDVDASSGQAEAHTTPDRRKSLKP